MVLFFFSFMVISGMMEETIVPGKKKHQALTSMTDEPFTLGFARMQF